MTDDDDALATILSTEVLARTNFSTLSRSVVLYRRRDGAVQRLVREAYDHGDGAAILLHDPVADRVLLVRQWRFGAAVNPRPDVPRGAGACLVEVPAGLVDGRRADDAIRAEAMEEVGVRVANPLRVLECYLSPGSLTERITLFVGNYSPGDRAGTGGGVAAEGEDIEILEPTVAEAFEMIRSGEIVDAKTIILLYHLRLFPGDNPGQ